MDFDQLNAVWCGGWWTLKQHWTSTKNLIITERKIIQKSKKVDGNRWWVSWKEKACLGPFESRRECWGVTQWGHWGSFLNVDVTINETIQLTVLQLGESTTSSFNLQYFYWMGKRRTIRRTEGKKTAAEAEIEMNEIEFTISSTPSITACCIQAWIYSLQRLLKSTNLATFCK